MRSDTGGNRSFSTRLHLRWTCVHIQAREISFQAHLSLYPVNRGGAFQTDDFRAIRFRIGIESLPQVLQGAAYPSLEYAGICRKCVRKRLADLVVQFRLKAVFSRDVIDDLPVELHTQFFKTGASQAKLSILARVGIKQLRFRKADGRNLNTLTVLGSVFDRDGNYVTGAQKTIDISLTDQRLDSMANGVTVKSTLDVAAGSYVIRLVVRDSEGQMMSALNGVVDIP
jgi:hypothetical protein